MNESDRVRSSLNACGERAGVRGRVIWPDHVALHRPRKQERGRVAIDAAQVYADRPLGAANYAEFRDVGDRSIGRSPKRIDAGASTRRLDAAMLRYYVGSAT